MSKRAISFQALEINAYSIVYSCLINTDNLIENLSNAKKIDSVLKEYLLKVNREIGKTLDFIEDYMKESGEVKI